MQEKRMFLLPLIWLIFSWLSVVGVGTVFFFRHGALHCRAVTIVPIFDCLNIFGFHEAGFKLPSHSKCRRRLPL